MYALRAFGPPVLYGPPPVVTYTPSPVYVPRLREKGSFRDLGLRGTFPVADLAFPYMMGSVLLDPPDIATAPLLQGGFVAYGETFTLLWYGSPATATQNALANGTMGTMTFPMHDGSKMSTTVRITSSTTNSMFVVVATVLTTTAVKRFQVETQFH